MRWNFRFASLSLAAVFLGLFFGGALAQSYPNKPIRFVVATGPGGGADIVIRTIGAVLSERLRQPIVVENVAGAGGIMASDIVAKAAPNGYVVVVRSSTFSIDPSGRKILPYNPVKDFEPIILMCFSPYVLSVHPSVPAKSVKELIALVKSKPGQLNYGSSGIGAFSHLSGELFKSMAGIDMVHIPYRGGPASVTAVLSGEVSMLFMTQDLVLPHHNAGKLRCLAALGARRTSAMPDLPTMGESGLPGYDVSQWYGVFAPAGTPKEIVKKLNSEILKVLNLPDVKKRLSKSYEIAGNSPEEFKTYFTAEIAKWEKLIKERGIVIDD